MRASQVLLALTGGGLLALVFIHVKLSHHAAGREPAGDADGSLLSLVRAQNETIATLSGLLAGDRGGAANMLESLRKKDLALRDLSDQLQAVRRGGGNTTTTSSACSPSLPPPPPLPLSSLRTTLNSPVGIDEVCERLYGFPLVESWKGNAQTWCESPASSAQTDQKSKLVCYPYHQVHKRNDGRGPDMFCEATNFFIDFSKVSGTHAQHGKPPHGQQYYDFRQGSLFSNCRKTAQFRPVFFMPHHAQQMGSFASDAPWPKAGTFTVEETATYLLARDEDCENSFHSTADFMNMYLVMQALGQAPSSMQVMLFDKHSDGPYTELIQKAFSAGRPPMRKEMYQNKVVLFRKLIFHLESPAGLIFPKVYNLVGRPEPLRCRATSLFTGYSRFVLEAFGLWDVQPPAIPQVTLSLRHRTASKNVGRILANENEVVNVLRSEGTMINVEVVDTSTMPYGQQLALIRRTNVLVGVHGAGLMLIMFAANEAVLVELHPSYRQDRHFRHAARMVGRHYMPMRSNVRETCQGSSDNVVVPIDEFRKAMDGALRLARNFDDGISECGLSCPSGVLALDSRLEPYYKPGERNRGARINTDFPC